MSQHFLPIDEYTHSPTLTNLNRLGQMMKESKSINIQKQTICQNLDQIKDMLFNINESIIKQSQPVIVSLEDKVLIKKYYEKGWKLIDYGWYQEAIECFDKGLKIDKENVDSLCEKGLSLKQLNKYKEAIKCFDQCIKIDPHKKDLYYYKGLTLQQIKKYEEAIRCFDEQIKIKPKHTNSYLCKGESLKILSHFRLEEEEQCYIEGLKHIPNHGDLKIRLSFVQEKMKKLQ